MPLLPRLSSLWRNLFHKDRVEQELKEEVEAYLELLIEMKIKQGLNPAEACRAALIELGGAEKVKEQVREVRMGYYLETLWQDLRYGLRMLRKSPGFTAVAVLSLALGIGANTTIFSVIDVLLLKTLPVRNPGALVLFLTGTTDAFGYDAFERLRDHTEALSGVAGVFNSSRYNVTVNAPGGGLDPGQVEVAVVSGNYFSVLGVNALMGRTLLPEDDRVPGGHPVTVISHGYWQRRFSLAPDVVGRTLRLNSTTYTILGVMPRGFSGDAVGVSTDLWFPIMMESQVMPEMPPLEKSSVRIIGRLQPGMTLEKAKAGINVIFRQALRDLAGPHPTPEALKDIERWPLQLESGARGYAPGRASFGRSLTILMIVVGLVLMIACANIANLLLARSAARQREMAVRLALGAGRYRVVRQLLTESVLLATLGGALGLLLARLGINAFVRLASSSATAVAPGLVKADLRLVDFQLDAPILAVTAGTCLLTGLLCGLAPAFRSAKTSLLPSLSGRGADSAVTGSRWGKLLVISQVTLSLVVLIVAGLFVRTLENLKTQNLGFDREHLLLVWTSPGQTGRQVAALGQYCRTMLKRLSSLPGVVSVSGSNLGLLNGLEFGAQSDHFKIEGEIARPGLLHMGEIVAPGYFQTVGQRLLAGRGFTERDNDQAPPVIIINETDARFFFGGQNPLGKHLSSTSGTGRPAEIVGVVEDAKCGTARDQRGHAYRPYGQGLNVIPETGWVVAVRTAGNPASLRASLRHELLDFDPTLPVVKINTSEEQLNSVLIQERLIAAVSGVFGGLATLLSCLGLYGVISYAVARRTNEIGIRLALGATPAGVLRMALKESLWLALAGIAIGIPATLAATRLISTMLYGVSAADPLTMVGAALLMIAVATLAAFLPARRASKVDPMVALRYE